MPLLSWTRKSDDISDYEDQIFSCLIKDQERECVQLGDDPSKQLWTLKMGISREKSTNLPLVMMHGLGAGIALWFKNLEELSADRPLYAFDLPGFGRSFRDKNQSFKTAGEAEDYFIDAIESWRKSMRLNEFILLGHSFGGYLASAYTLKYPTHVKGIVLVDAWGFSKRRIQDLQLPRSAKIGLSVYKTLSPNPLSFLRAVGSWGPSLITRIRPDIVRKYQHRDLSDGVIANYVYHCNALEPSGEIAFKSLVEEMGDAQRPMSERIGDIYPHIPIAMVNGKESWIDHSICEEVKRIRDKSFVHIELVSEAGHHVYVDQPDVFNQLVRRICCMFDEHKAEASVKGGGVDGGRVGVGGVKVGSINGGKVVVGGGVEDVFVNNDGDISDGRINGENNNNWDDSGDSNNVEMEIEINRISIKDSIVNNKNEKKNDKENQNIIINKIQL